MNSLILKEGHLFYLDQRALPAKEIWREAKTLNDCFLAIKQLRIRGAPLIGVFAAYSVYIGIKNFKQKDTFLDDCNHVISYLNKSRPTAVNLFWALNRMQTVLSHNSNKDVTMIKRALFNEAKRIHLEDQLLCQRMADHGVKLINSGDTILTHCNTGFLATSGQGTALAVIFKANEIYKNIQVYVDETRPLLQGARLTSWELLKKGVCATLITDNMAAYLMQQRKIDKVFLGADRIAANGDTANKIGTYSVAVNAKYHKIPFYVVAPLTTFDFSLKTGKEIPIEQRDPEEVRKPMNKNYISPRKILVYNPAFDVTPHNLITAIVTDKGAIYPPFSKNIRKYK